MRVKKKITKKKLKEPDEFLSITEHAYLFITKHGKKVGAVVIAVCIIVLAYFSFQWWDKRKEADASQKLNLAIEIYQTVNAQNRESTPGENKGVIQKFDEIVKTFPGTTSAKTALLYKANISLSMKEYDEAIKAYQAYLDKAGKVKLYRLFALEGTGYAYEGKKEYQKAADAFQKMADLGEGALSADAYLGLGRCYEKLGKTKEALESYKGYLKVSPKSTTANAVSGKIAQLEK